MDAPPPQAEARAAGGRGGATGFAPGEASKATPEAKQSKNAGSQDMPRQRPRGPGMACMNEGGGETQVVCRKWIGRQVGG